MIVESNAARKHPNQILLMTRSNCPVPGSSASGTWFSSRLLPALSVCPRWLSSSSGVTLPLPLPSNGLVSEEGSSTLSCSVNAMALRINVHMAIAEKVSF